MKTFLSFILIAFTLSFASCSSSRDFTIAEQKYIQQGDSAQRMRMFTFHNQYDALVLRKPSADLKKIKHNKTLQLLLDRMLVTMYAEEGIGIAAPQVGINRNIFLFTRIHENDEKIQVAINPKIVAHSEELVCFKRDGCLSVPDKRGNSKRFAWIEVEYYNENGKKIKERLSGHERPKDFTGIIFQHEFDHICGRLYIDKLCD